jgi:hypothetical protein
MSRTPSARSQKRAAKPLPISMRVVRQAWRTVALGAPWPKGWTVRWGDVDAENPEIARRRGSSRAITDFDKRIIVVDLKDAIAKNNAVDSLVHEFAHLWLMTDGWDVLPMHGKEFRGIAQTFRIRLGLDPSRATTRCI